MTTSAGRQSARPGQSRPRLAEPAGSNEPSYKATDRSAKSPTSGHGGDPESAPPTKRTDADLAARVSSSAHRPVLGIGNCDGAHSIHRSPVVSRGARRRESTMQRRVGARPQLPGDTAYRGHDHPRHHDRDRVPCQTVREKSCRRIPTFVCMRQCLDHAVPQAEPGCQYSGPTWRSRPNRTPSRSCAAAPGHARRGGDRPSQMLSARGRTAWRIEPHVRRRLAARSRATFVTAA